MEYIVIPLNIVNMTQKTPKNRKSQMIINGNNPPNNKRSISPFAIDCKIQAIAGQVSGSQQSALQQQHYSSPLSQK